MPTFEVEQYELHVQTFRIDAPSEAEAIAKLLAGEAEPDGEGSDYVQVCKDYGLPAEEHRHLADELRNLGVRVGEHLIPSIRSVREVTP
jgi:hypothetical protein